jgi:hypothetical protein
LELLKGSRMAKVTINKYNVILITKFTSN